MAVSKQAKEPKPKLKDVRIVMESKDLTSSIVDGVLFALTRESEDSSLLDYLEVVELTIKEQSDGGVAE